MKLISFNVNGIRACLQKGLLNFVNSTNADIYCFQETKAYPDQIQFDGWEEYPYWIWARSVKPGYSGVASFSKNDFINASTEFGVTRYDQEGRFNIIEFEDFILYNIYFPNGAMNDERHFFKMDFLKDLLGDLKKTKSKPIVITGDYNIAHKNEDIHDPVRLDGESGFKPEEREWMDRLYQAGYRDCFRYKHPQDVNVYSWWSYRQRSRENNKGWRIDYFWVSEAFLPRVKDCYYLMDAPGSDHCPVVLELI